MSIKNYLNFRENKEKYNFQFNFRFSNFLIKKKLIFSGQLLQKEHRTHAATERANDLHCYQCDSMEDGEQCAELVGNHTSFQKKCKSDKRICIVRN